MDRFEATVRSRRCWLAPLLLAGGLLLVVPPALADGEPASFTVRTLVQSTQAWNGTGLPAYPRGQPEVTVLHITIPPGVTLPMHQHPVINAGEGPIERVNQPHYGTNNGTESAEIVVVYAGGLRLGDVCGCGPARRRSVQAVQLPAMLRSTPPTDDQAETDSLWNAMVGNDGEDSACGWSKDR